MPLTDLKIRALKPETKSRKYTDGGNMYLEVKPNGSKLWKMGYTYAGKQETLSFGPYPGTTLAKAREKREEARALLRDGIDPIVHAREVEAQRQAEFGNLFSEIAAELLEKNCGELCSEPTGSRSYWSEGASMMGVGGDIVMRSNETTTS